MAETADDTLASLVSSLETLGVEQLTALISAAEAARDAKRSAARQQLIAEFRTKAEAIGVPFGDLFSAIHEDGRASGRSLAGRKIAVKYRGPNGEEWTGKGKTPRWLVALEGEGRARDQFAV